MADRDAGREEDPPRNAAPNDNNNNNNDNEPANEGSESRLSRDPARALFGAGEQSEEEPEGEDLLDEQNIQNDYAEMPHLDRYEADGLEAESETGANDPENEARARMAAEDYMDERDARDGGNARGGRRRPRALLQGEDEEDLARARQRRRLADFAAEGHMSEDEEEGDGLDERIENIEEVKGRLADWLQHRNVRREIIRRFRRFLKSYGRRSAEGKGEGHSYEPEITQMVIHNRQSLEVDFEHLTLENTTTQLAMWVADCPREMLEILDEALRQEVLRRFPNQADAAEEIRVRIHNLPVTDSLRDLRQSHLNVFVQVSGVITRRGSVYPQLGSVTYDCTKCGFVMGPFVQSQEEELAVKACPSCQSKGPFNVDQQMTKYRNYQKITLQESPGTVPAGRLPRQKDVVLLNDLADSARPGDEVVVAGIFTNNFDDSLTMKNGFPVFATQIKAVHMKKRGDLIGNNAAKLTEADKAQIHSLSLDSSISSRIVQSIAPSIHGHDNIKLALALALFGGREKHIDKKTRLRGDINCLLLGDPGVAKSQFLKFLEKASPRAVYTTGKGASAVGLTASVRKDPVTMEWTLEGGALVLADRGMCLIDEFDKMNENDRVSIHEAMEQQNISISKAGIVTSLQARCSVVAAANPSGGKYNQQLTFAENVQLTDPILSRFDVLAVIKDTVDEEHDRQLARFVMQSHVSSHPDAPRETVHPSQTENANEEGGQSTGNSTSGHANNNNTNAAQGEGATDADAEGKNQRAEPISHEALRKYVTYAKEHCKPRLRSETDLNKIQHVYAELRRESVTREGMPVAVRHIESVVRMSEAHASLHLRDFVTDDDISVALKVMLNSFIATQKAGVQRSLSRKFSRYIE